MADDLLVDVSRLAARIQEPIETPEEIESAEELILSASDEARFYGLESWTAETAPPIVKNVVLGACQRAFQNPGNFESERADAVSFKYSEEGMGTVSFTPEEIKRIEHAAGKKRSFSSVPVARNDGWHARSSRLGRNTVWVPVDSYAPGAKPFPWE